MSGYKAGVIWSLSRTDAALLEDELQMSLDDRNCLTKARMERGARVDTEKSACERLERWIAELKKLQKSRVDC
jgi:hypothetical protein